MVPLLLLPLLWGGSLQQPPGYELRVQESVTVQEGLCVHVPCSFYPWRSWFSSTTVYTYWYRDGDNTNRDAAVASSNRDKRVKSETQGRFLLANPTTNNCSLQIRDARMSDTGRYFFRVERGTQVKYSYQEKMLDLQVTGAAVDSLDPQNRSSSVLTFTPRSGDHGTNLTCQVKREGSQWIMQRTIWLNVSYAPHGGWSWRGVYLLGSQLLSFSLSEQSSPHSSRCVTEEQQGSWPLVLTLIRGALMGAGFLLTYVLTWLYYTRCGGPRNRRQSS